LSDILIIVLIKDIIYTVTIMNEDSGRAVDSAQKLSSLFFQTFFLL